MTKSAHRIAALDVGTNTVLMLVAERRPNGRPVAIAEMNEITRLGRGVDKTGKLDPDSCARTLAAIEKFVEQAKSLGASRIVTAATSALRDSSNGAEFVELVKQRTRVELRIVGGEAEARLSFIAVRDGLNLRGNLLIVDIGGGSTELIWTDETGPRRMLSLQLGSVRMTERFLHSDPPSPTELQELSSCVEAQLREATKGAPKPSQLVGIAGTVTTICAVAVKMRRYDSALVHGAHLSHEKVREVTHRLQSMTIEQRKSVPGMVAGRADVIAAGAIILDRILALYGFREVVVSDQGVRWGMVYQELALAPA